MLRSGLTQRPPIALNGDGTLLVFSDNGIQLLELNRVTGEILSVADSGDFINAPAISMDGRFIIYSRRSCAENCASLTWCLYVRDQTLGITTLISTNLESASANAPVSRAVLALDGRTAVFHSVASDLVSGDFNDKHDVFVLRLGGADTDGDGMDDDWEVAYFGNLSRNGSGDYDNDGATDLAEFLAGTDPTNSNSVFRVLTVAPAGGGNTLVLWTGNPTLSYRAEFKDDLGVTTWTPLTGTITWNGSTASIPDVTATNSAHRYYRVVRLP